MFSHADNLNILATFDLLYGNALIVAKSYFVDFIELTLFPRNPMFLQHWGKSFLKIL